MFIVSRSSNGQAISYSGSQYTPPLDGKKLCIRTGTGPNDILKYGLTSNSSASSYCGMRMRIENGIAYIGRSEVKSVYSDEIYTTTSTSSQQTDTVSNTVINTTEYYTISRYTTTYTKTITTRKTTNVSTTRTTSKMISSLSTSTQSSNTYSGSSISSTSFISTVTWPSGTRTSTWTARFVSKSTTGTKTSRSTTSRGSYIVGVSTYLGSTLSKITTSTLRTVASSASYSFRKTQTYSGTFSESLRCSRATIYYTSQSRGTYSYSKKYTVATNVNTTTTKNTTVNTTKSYTQPGSVIGTRSITSNITTSITSTIQITVNTSSTSQKIETYTEANFNM